MKKTNILTKLAFVIICVILLVQIINVSEKLSRAVKDRALLRAEIAELEGSVANLEHKIENRDDDAVLEDIARSELGMRRRGEQVFYD